MNIAVCKYLDWTMCKLLVLELQDNNYEISLESLNKIKVSLCDETMNLESFQARLEYFQRKSLI